MAETTELIIPQPRTTLNELADLSGATQLRIDINATNIEDLAVNTYRKTYQARIDLLKKQTTHFEELASKAIKDLEVLRNQDHLPIRKKYKAIVQAAAKKLGATVNETRMDFQIRGALPDQEGDDIDLDVGPPEKGSRRSIQCTMYLTLNGQQFSWPMLLAYNESVDTRKTAEQAAEYQKKATESRTAAATMKTNENTVMAGVRGEVNSVVTTRSLKQMPGGEELVLNLQQVCGDMAVELPALDAGYAALKGITDQSAKAKQAPARKSKKRGR